MNFKIVAHTLGWVLSFEAVCMILPLVCALIYSEAAFMSFLICIAICLAAGVPLILMNNKDAKMYSREGFTIVALSWIVMSIFGALPFVISGSIPNFINALFETVSGFTTTGASVVADVEALPKSILFWRSFTHWIGGMGVIVFLVAILPLSGGRNMHLVKAESPGPSVGKLVPKVRETAKLLYTIYFVLTVIEVALLLAGDMSLFEALTISFGTAGTGGFAVLNSSMGEYSSYIQVVVTIFMIVFGVNFSIYYLILIGKIKTAFRSSELWAYLGVIAASIFIISINCAALFDTVAESIKHSAFQVGSIITTTGFATTDFDKWPELSKTILVVLMFIGASAGSTGGGIKVSRIMILLKSIVKEIKISAHPKSTHKVKMDGRTIEHETIRGANVFMISYLLIFAFSLLAVSLDNMDFTTNFTAVAATINNVGPGLARVGPTQNFGSYSAFAKLVFIFDMLIGRLEIFPLLVLFSPYAWKK
ncbi:MAG: TrkH family potassium uptake protein [Clostridia bacterium]|nr:TrkH family potassium uptake protein [Clostridia bacterium]